MIVRVSTLGAADGNAAGAASAVVKYLDGRGPARAGTAPGTPSELPRLDGTTGIVGYYADSVEGPGTWLGHGIAGMRLTGQVDPEAFHRVLTGRHGVTGEQLVGAHDLAGRGDRKRHHAPVAAHGEADETLSLPQAATLLGVSDRYLRRLAAETAALQAEQARATAAGDTPPQTPGTYLVAGRNAENRWQVTRGEVERFAAERTAPAAVVGYDLTFSAPKSVSILWARADAERRAQIVAAIDKSVAVGIDYIEDHAAWVGRAKTHRRAAGIVAAGYTHATSRALDPQLHCHVVVTNMAESPTGAIVALDGRPLYAHAKTAGYLAAAQLRHELATSLGVEWETAERGIADIAGVSDAAIAEMSRRSAQIDELTQTLGLDSAAARQAAAYASRTAKDHAVDPEALRPAWRRRLDAVGFDDRAATACYDRQAAPLLVTSDDRASLFAALGGAHGVTERSSTFDRRDVLQFVAQWAGDRLDAAGICDLGDEWLGTETVVSVDAGRREGRSADVIRRGDGRVVSAVGDEALYTTRQVLDIEQRLFEIYETGRHAGVAVVDSAGVEAVLAWRPALGADQVEMVRAITRSGRQVQCVLGPAGSGKTTALEAAVRAWEGAGFVPIATAVQGTHAEQLGNRTGTDARTVASLVTGVASGAVTIDARSVVLVDECSTLGNRDLLALMEMVATAGGALRLVGDPAQHDAVAAGGAWRRLLEDRPGDRAELTEQRRQSGDDMADVRLALGAYRQNRVSEAIEGLRAGCRVVEADSPEAVMDALVADWYADRQRRRADPSLAISTMTADHHVERRELNRRARALLIADGTLAGPSLDLPGMSFRVGDEVIAVQGDRRLRAAEASYRDHVKTGERGTVVEVRLGREARRSALVVNFERRGRVVVDHGQLTQRLRPGVVGRLAHSYALTTYAAQGETYEAGRGLATEAAMRAGVYVALSRGRSDAKLYVLRRKELLANGDDHVAMPRLESTSAILAEVTARLQAQHAEHLATQVDADAPEVARLRRAHDLGELAAVSTGPDPTAAMLARRALADELAAIATREHLHPDPALVARLGPRPNAGERRRLWDTAVGEVATYRARWGAEPVAGGPGSSWALGAGRSGRAGQDYATAAALLRRAEATWLAQRPTHELADKRGELLDLGACVDDSARARTVADSTASAADDLAAAQATRRARQRRLERLQDRGGRRHNLQGIELATRDVDAAVVAVARATARFDEAAKRQAAAAGDPDGARDGAERLATIDAALSVQAVRALDEPASYLSAIVGPRPESPHDRALWNVGALAVETYRHVRLGLTRDARASADVGDALARVVGARPEGPGAAAYYEMLSGVHRARTDLLLVALAREAPAIAEHAAPIRRLARGSLPSLADELQRTRVAKATRAVAERRASAARQELRAAEATSDDLAARKVHRRGRRTATAALADSTAQAQRLVTHARAGVEVAEAALADTPAPPKGQVAVLEEAVCLRDLQVQAETLRKPPAWLRADAARRVATYPPGHDGLDSERLARAYGAVAAYAERAGLGGAERLDDIVDPPPRSDDLATFRAAVIDDLDLSLDAAMTAGIDVSV